jgi:hypothetical protein
LDRTPDGAREAVADFIRGTRNLSSEFFLTLKESWRTKIGGHLRSTGLKVVATEKTIHSSFVLTVSDGQIIRF